jgi:hypothetical protein
MRTDGQTGMTMLIVAIRNFADTPKNLLLGRNILERLSPHLAPNTDVMRRITFLCSRIVIHTWGI